MSNQRPENAIPKWMPSDDERIAAARISAFDGMYYRTGLRAQIAKLEEARDALCGIPETFEMLKLTTWLAKETAALRKELENE